jgi:hypothetical protein
LDPDDSLPLPVPTREVSLAERYAVLAAVWNVYWKGDEKINPWANSPFDGEGVGYMMLLAVIGRTESDGLIIRRLKKGIRTVQTWLVNVKADLCNGSKLSLPKSVKSNRRGPQKADYETQQLEAELAAEWQRAHNARIYKADFARDRGMKVTDLDRLLDRVAARKKHSE